MFVVTFKNARGTTLGRGVGTIPATALVEALADLGGLNPLVCRAVTREWETWLLGRAVDTGAGFLSATHPEYDIELLENGVSMFIHRAGAERILAA